MRGPRRVPGPWSIRHVAGVLIAFADGAAGFCLGRAVHEKTIKQN
jgi:hypothetical protein